MRYSEISTELDEHAVAKPGDFDAALALSSISQFMFERNWTVIGTIALLDQQFAVACFNRDPLHFVMGRLCAAPVDSVDQKPRFSVLFEIEFGQQAELSSKLGYPSLQQVIVVGVKDDQRGRGIAQQMYLWFLRNRGMTILDDRTQYFGARRLWAALSKEVNAVVDIVDVQAGTVLERGVTLHHGQYDHDFDQRVWSYGQEIAHIRVVLRDLSDAIAP